MLKCRSKPYCVGDNCCLNLLSNQRVQLFNVTNCLQPHVHLHLQLHRPCCPGLLHASTVLTFFFFCIGKINASHKVGPCTTGCCCSWKALAGIDAMCARQRIDCMQKLDQRALGSTLHPGMHYTQLMRTVETAMKHASP